MMRVAIFGKSKKRTRKVAHITRAFREKGCETIWLNPSRIARWKGNSADEHILKALDSFKPDIVFIFSQDIPLRVLENISGSAIKTVMFYVDWAPQIPGSLIERGRRVDVFVVAVKGMVERYREMGIKNPVFLMDACDRYDHHRQTPLLPLWKSDVAFIGQARPDELRLRVVRRLRDICRVRVYGRNWKDFGIRPTLRSVGPRGYRLICSGAKIVVGADKAHDVAYGWSNRLWLTLGCGGFLLTNYVPGMEEVFTNREHLVWYRSEEECISLVREYLEKPDERYRIAEAGYRYVHEHHTFHHFVDRILELCRT